MKKVVLLCLIVLMTGCYEDSGKLTTTCVKKEKLNTIYSETTYSIDFKANEINNVIITYYYKDSNLNNISSIKQAINSSDKFINGLSRNIEIDNDFEFKISYNVDLNNKEVVDKFEIKDTRSNLVKSLKEKGYECN